MKTPAEIIASVDAAHPNRNRPLEPYIEAAWNEAIDAALRICSDERDYYRIDALKRPSGQGSEGK